VQLCLCPLAAAVLSALHCKPISTYIAVYRYYRILSENIAFAIIAHFCENPKITANLRLVIDG
jgi:hypothetical protein